MRKITRGASANAGLIFHVFVQDSTSTSGAGKASLAFSDFSCRYIRNGEALSGAITPQDITTIGTYAAPTANTNIRIKAVDNTNAIGIYEVQIHADWVNTTNSCQSLTIYLSASGAATLPIQIPLVADDEQIAKPSNFAATVISAGGVVSADAVQISGDATAADNAEAFFDGTGYAGGAILLGVNAVQISGDGGAADNLENLLDGTGGTLTGNLVGSVDSALSLGTGAITNAVFAAGAITNSVLAADVLDVSNITVATYETVADYVWDEQLSGHLGAGSTGAALNAAGAAGDPWSTALPGAYGAGTAGFIIGTNLNAAVADVEADTQDIQARLPAALVGGRMDSNVQATAASLTFNLTGNVTGNLSGSVGSVTGAVGSVATGGITAASFAANAVDAAALAADAVAEIQSGLATAVAVADIPTVAEFEARTLPSADYFVVGDYTAPPTSIENADALLGRDLSAVAGAASRSPLNGLRFLVNGFEIVGANVNILDEVGGTAFTRALQTNAAAEPITGMS